MNEQAIFIGALQLDDPAARDEYLADACGGDSTLRRRVQILLEAYEQAGSFLDSPAVRPPGSRVPDESGIDATLDHDSKASGAERSEETETKPHRATESTGSTIGSYKLLQKLGEGGMGTVFMAEQERPVRRRVALKIIKPGMDSRQVIARFEAERQALAIMDHNNIARVLDAGTTDADRPYFVMELVNGVSA